MVVEQAWDIPRINNRPISIYAMLVESGGLLLGCGAWDRKRQEHSMEIKNATPGMVLRVNKSGKVVGETECLKNIVYPLVSLPWGEFFIGCRTGAAYFMDHSLRTRYLGSFGQGVYGVAHMAALGRLLVGGRNGILFSLDSDGFVKDQWVTNANRLWNLCPHQQNSRQVWASSYNGVLYQIDAASGNILLTKDFSPGAATLISYLSNGTLAVGSLRKKVLLLDQEGRLMKVVSAQGGICFVADLPDSNAFVATDHDGRIFIADYEGRILDRYEKDVQPNNPIWIAQTVESNRIYFAWANGIVRILRY